MRGCGCLMGIEALILGAAEGEKYRRAHGVPTTQDMVKELFADLELPYDLTGVEILREYLMSLGKDNE